MGCEWGYSHGKWGQKMTQDLYSFTQVIQFLTSHRRPKTWSEAPPLIVTVFSLRVASRAQVIRCDSKPSSEPKYPEVCVCVCGAGFRHWWQHTWPQSSNPCAAFAEDVNRHEARSKYSNSLAKESQIQGGGKMHHTWGSHPSQRPYNY